MSLSQPTQPQPFLPQSSSGVWRSAGDLFLQVSRVASRPRKQTGPRVLLTVRGADIEHEPESCTKAGFRDVRANTVRRSCSCCIPPLPSSRCTPSVCALNWWATRCHHRAARGAAPVWGWGRPRPRASASPFLFPSRQPTRVGPLFPLPPHLTPQCAVAFM